jgi:hypothetical protein
MDVHIKDFIALQVLETTCENSEDPRGLERCGERWNVNFLFNDTSLLHQKNFEIDPMQCEFVTTIA